MSSPYDVVVVGAGVIGLACAERLSRDGRRVLLLERNGSFGRETSSRSSEVVHAGMYYPTGSLKAQLCVAGNRSLETWCTAHGVRLVRIGKYIVASTRDEEEQLGEIHARGLANGCDALERVGTRELAAREPAIVASAALFSPRTGIVDSHALMASLLAAAREQGIDVAFRHALVAARRTSSGYRIRAIDAHQRASGIDARCVVNAAGLASDEVASAIGIDVDAAGYRLSYVKGRYFRVRGPSLVRSLVYPVPPRSLESLGIHVTLDMEGNMRLGPDVVVLADRELDYDVPEEVGDLFHAAASRYLRGLAREDVVPDQSGIRPRIIRRDRSSPSDFVIAEESARGLPGWIDLIGIESPGLTCALEIADRVAALAP